MSSRINSQPRLRTGRGPSLGALFLAVGVLFAFATTHGDHPPSNLLPHNIHVSYGRAAVENDVVAARLRFFRHDLEHALAQFQKLDSFSIDSSLASDSLFLRYLGESFSIVSGDLPLEPRIVSSGEDQESWWYELHFSPLTPIQELTIRNELFFELFADQKHFLTLTFFPSQNSHRLYFVDGSATYTVANTAAKP